MYIYSNTDRKGLTLAFLLIVLFFVTFLFFLSFLAILCFIDFF